MKKKTDAIHKFKTGEFITPKQGRLSSKDNKFKDYKAPFKVTKIISSKSASYCELVLRCSEGRVFNVWSDAFLPNRKEEEEFNIFW